MKWISVKDKLPPEPADPSKWKTYLTWDDGGCEICFYRGDGRWSSLIYESHMLTVTHWLDGPKLV